MNKISRKRRAELREATKYPFHTILVQAPEPLDTVMLDYTELRALLDYADEHDHLHKAYEDKEEALRVCSGDVYRVECERDEAVALLRRSRQEINALLRRLGDPE